MKKIALLLLAGLGFTFTQAQAQGVQIGLKAGANYSNISGDLQHEDIYQNKLGFVGGITTNIPLSTDGFLNLAPELLFSQKGYQYRDQEFMVNGVNHKRKGDVAYNYLDLPVLLKVNAGGLFFEGGPVGSYLLNIKDNTEEKIGSESFERTRTIDKGDVNQFEVGYAAGLGFMAPMGLSVGLRYNGSINALANDADNGNLKNARHSLFQLSLGFMLGGGTK